MIVIDLLKREPIILMLQGLVELREAIKPRPSQLDLDVPLSVHPAPDILGS